MPDRFAQRTQALLERLRQDAVDGMLVTNLPNVRYLSGFSGSSAILLVTAAQRWLFTDFRYAVQANAEAGAVATIVIESSSLWRGVWETLRATRNVHTLGFESAHMPHRDFERLLKDGSAWKWMPLIDVVERLREVKDATELASIRDAGQVAASALERTLACVQPGMTELQVAGILEHALRDFGSEVAPFATIVASGERTALPHARAATRAIARGDFLLLDFGATVNGYVSDVTRTVVVGQADERQREVHAAVQAANEAARLQVRSGMTGKEADAIARGVLEHYGLSEAFGHGLGHGIGLEVHEGPRLSRISEQVLPAGAVVTIEPGVYVAGWGGVRIEDDVCLSPNGAELLTEMPRHLIELS